MNIKFIKHLKEAYLKAKIQSIELSSKYIPNSESHIREWSKEQRHK